MHFKSLKVFCDIVARRSFSRAADENDMSQSGASQVVNQLERHLGVKLIDRSKRPFVLTAAGEVYYEGCRKLVQRYDALEEEVRGSQQEVDGRVRVVSIFSVGLSYMKDFVRRFEELYPKAHVQLEYQHPERVYEQVETDGADIGLVSYPKKARAIETIPWRKEPMVLVCSPEHPLASQRPVRARDLTGQRMVGFYNHLTIRREIDRALAAQGIDVEVVLEFDNIELLKRALEIDTVISLLPEPTVSREVEAGTLVAQPVEGLRLIRPVGIVHRRGAQLGLTARRFIELLTQQADGSLSSLSDLPPAEGLESSGLESESAGSNDGPESGGEGSHRRGAEDEAPALRGVPQPLRAGV